MLLNKWAYRRLAVNVSGRPRSLRVTLPDCSRRALARQRLHHRAAVHLPELLRVELRQQLAQRGADQVLTAGREHAHGFVGGFEAAAAGHADIEEAHVGQLSGYTKSLPVLYGGSM